MTLKVFAVNNDCPYIFFDNGKFSHCYNVMNVSLAEMLINTGSLMENNQKKKCGPTYPAPIGDILRVTGSPRHFLARMI